MASIEDHEQDTIRQLGKPFTEIHEYMDQYVATFGASHRFKLHHREGIEEVRRKFGEEAGFAAECHVRLDCKGRVPTEQDYATGEVDRMGYRAEDFVYWQGKRVLVARDTGEGEKK